MRKQLLAATVFLGINSLGFAQDTIPNPDFENWESGTMVDEPSDWGTANNMHIQFNNCATQVSAVGDFYSGSSAIQLTTVEYSCPSCQVKKWRVAGTAVAGGYISQDWPFTFGGFDYTKRPLYLGGYCKYIPQQSAELYQGKPVGIDKSNIQVYLTKSNGTTTDTIGQGQLSPTNSTWAPFSVEIKYDPKFTGNPDTAQIIIASSKGVETAKGSKFYVDSLFFDFTIGVEEYTFDKFQMTQNSPNPFKNSTSISFTSERNQILDFTVTDVVGRDVFTAKINAVNGINTYSYNSRLMPGTYFYSITDGQGKSTKKMIVTE